MPVHVDESKIMERIRAFLAIANNAPEGDPERESALSAANALMTKHAIDMAKLDAERDPLSRRVPISMRFQIFDDPSAADWWANFRTILSEIIYANRCQGAFHYGYNNEITIVGMSEDVEWCQMLWMQIFFEFMSKIKPTWEKNRTVGANVMAFKEAGYDWRSIWEAARLANDGDSPDGQLFYDPQKARWLMREYRAEQRRTGKAHVGTQRHGAYRRSFVEAFTQRIAARLEEMRNANTAASKGNELVLASVEDRIKVEFYNLFPRFHPDFLAQERERWEAEETEARRKDQEWLESLSEKQRRKVLEEREAKERAQARKDARYWAKKEAHNRPDEAGFRAGRAAAEAVSLERGNIQVDTPERREIDA